jgi:hypothetical protein
MSLFDVADSPDEVDSSAEADLSTLDGAAGRPHAVGAGPAPPPPALLHHQYISGRRRGSPLAGRTRGGAADGAGELELAGNVAPLLPSAPFVSELLGFFC